MTPNDGALLPPGLSEDRRILTDRRRLATVEIGRILGVVASQEPGSIVVRGTRDTGAPIVLTVRVEAAMALLNDLQQLAIIDGWFDIKA
ncbi:MAG: hypothetical protein ABI609_01035 [Acidobacteriota bacterium]